MSINLVTYANQTVTPTNDAIIYERAIDQNGIFYGCNVTVSSNNVNITGGYGIICGREFVIESESIPVTLAPSVPLDGRLYVRLDLADADNPIQLLTAQGATLPALEQDANVNYTNGTWEMELATFTVGVSALSDVAETFETIVGTKQFNAWSQIYATGFSANNTLSKVTGTIIRRSDNGSEYFTLGTDQITIKKAGTYKITITWVLSAATNTSSVKRIALYKNDAEIVSCLSRCGSYENTTMVAINNFVVGDVLTMYKRAEDNNSTFGHARILIETMRDTYNA